MQDFFVPLFSILLAELGDKTQIALMMLSARTLNRRFLLAGAMAGFFIVDGAAVLAGAWLSRLIPQAYLTVLAAAIFIVFGAGFLISAFRAGKEEEAPGGHTGRSAFKNGLLIIVVAEMGDKTQFAAGLLATQYHPFLVLSGTLCALALVSALAVYAGKLLASRIRPRPLKIAAGLLFISIGFSFFFF